MLMLDSVVYSGGQELNISFEVITCVALMMLSVSHFELLSNIFLQKGKYGQCGFQLQWT